jgi:hypothetical protein
MLDVNKKPSLGEVITKAEEQTGSANTVDSLRAEVARLTRENAELRFRQEEMASNLLADFEGRLRMELAYEIFGEIQSRLAQFSHYRIAAVEGIIKMIAALKKKYTEGGSNNGDER